MNRFVKRLLTVTALAMALLSSTGSATAQNNTGTEASSVRLSSADAKRAIAGRALEVLRAVRGRDMRRLSSFVHPDKGLRFSPYIYVQASDRVLTRWQVANLFRNNRRQSWGEEDGTGDPIRLTARQFFNRYIYDKDYLRAREVNYNTRQARGNTVNNVLEFYPRSIAVEYYLPGTNSRYSGMDWGSLWLIFEQKAGTWYLVGMASDEWTT